MSLLNRRRLLLIKEKEDNPIIYEAGVFAEGCFAELWYKSPATDSTTRKSSVTIDNEYEGVPCMSLNVFDNTASGLAGVGLKITVPGSLLKKYTTLNISYYLNSQNCNVQLINGTYKTNSTGNNNNPIIREVIPYAKGIFDTIKSIDITYNYDEKINYLIGMAYTVDMSSRYADWLYMYVRKVWLE